MKKFFYVAVLFTGMGIGFAKSPVKIFKSKIEQKEIRLSECCTQTSTDESGDVHSVTCCRTTFAEAYDCASKKLRDSVFGPSNQNP